MDDSSIIESIKNLVKCKNVKNLAKYKNIRNLS